MLIFSFVTRDINLNVWDEEVITLMRKSWWLVSVYSSAHFVVDFACAFLMFRAISSTPDWYLYLLIYNFCAFALQMPIGVLADRLNRNFLFAIIGCALTAAAYAFWSLPLAAVIAAGVGNGLFHIGGGVDVLNISDGKAGALGVFVSPGAFGIYFGTILGKGNAKLGAIVVLVLLAAAALVFVMRRKQGEEYVNNAPFSLDGAASRNVLPAVICFFLVVCLRSYLGLAIEFPWKSSGYWGVILVCAVVFGKMAGGFISDRLGAVRTACISLAPAALLFLIPHIPIAGVFSMFCFNMTMPITLCAVAKVFPGAKGFSFGLLTFGLFLGFLPVYMGATLMSGASWVFAAIAVASVLLLAIGLRKVSRFVNADLPEKGR